MRLGELLKLCEIENGSDDFAKLITQGELPESGRPGFFVHPCRTAEMMKNIDSSVSNYLLGWISWVSSPLLNISFPRVNYALVRRVLVSIIVPVFNGAQFLPELVDSISAQISPKKEEIEVIFCNDCSTDDSSAILRLLAAEKLADFNVVILENEKNSGSGFSRNRCIERARGEYLCFLDSDDVMHPMRIEMQMKIAQSSDCLIGCLMNCFPNRKPFYEWINSLVLAPDLLAYRFREITVPLPTWFIRRSVFCKCGMFLEAQKYEPEDLDWFLRFLQNGGTLFKVSEPLLKYRIHENQSSNQMHRKLLMKVKVGYFETFAKANLTQGFMIWGSGRDGKDFFRNLSEEGRKLVLNFVEISPKKIGLSYEGKKILGIEAVKPPFVCCVAIGKNNGIEEKLEPYQAGVDYYQIT